MADEQLWGTLAALSVPFVGFIGPLVVLLVFRDRSPWLGRASRDSLSFSLLYTGALVVSLVLFALYVGPVLLLLVVVGGLVQCVLGALAASRHELYRYPFSWPAAKQGL